MEVATYQEYFQRCKKQSLLKRNSRKYIQVNILLPLTFGTLGLQKQEQIVKKNTKKKQDGYGMSLTFNNLGHINRLITNYNPGVTLVRKSIIQKTETSIILVFHYIDVLLLSDEYFHRQSFLTEDIGQQYFLPNLIPLSSKSIGLSNN